MSFGLAASMPKPPNCGHAILKKGLIAALPAECGATGGDVTSA